MKEYEHVLLWNDDILVEIIANNIPYVIDIRKIREIKLGHPVMILGYEIMFSNVNYM